MLCHHVKIRLAGFGIVAVRAEENRIFVLEKLLDQFFAFEAFEGAEIALKDHVRQGEKLVVDG